jgi:hypothetical protein
VRDAVASPERWHRIGPDVEGERVVFIHERAFAIDREYRMGPSDRFQRRLAIERLSKIVRELRKLCLRSDYHDAALAAGVGVNVQFRV